MTSQPRLRDRAYRHLRRKMEAGELVPGSRVSELSLAKEIGISRTPVRDAIRMLENEGLVKAVPRFGTVVRAPDRLEIAELYELREALEAFAAEKAAERATDADLAALEAFCDEIGAAAGRLQASGAKALAGAPLRKFLAADLGFHLRLLRAAGNDRLLRSASDSRALTGIFGVRRQDHTAAVVAAAWRHHAAILGALRKRDGVEARRLVAAHIAESRDAALDHIDRVGAATPDAFARELERIESGFPTERTRP